MGINIENETFGVEIEMIGPERIQDKLTNKGFRCVNRGYTHEVIDSWKVVSDSSVHSNYEQSNRDLRGMELVSPILKGEAGLIEVFKIMKTLRELGCEVNSTCGFHVHVGAQRTDIEFFKNLYKIYHDFEPVIDTFMPKSRRGNESSYCRSLTRENVKNLFANESLTPNYLSRNYDRFHKLNYASFNSYQTVEFRQHSGTLNGSKAIAWIRTCLSMVQKARKGGYNNLFVLPRPDTGRANDNSLPSIFNVFIRRIPRRTVEAYPNRIIRFMMGHRNGIVVAATHSYKDWVSHEEICEYLGCDTWGTVPMILERLQIKFEEKRIGRQKYFRLNLREFGYVYEEDIVSETVEPVIPQIVNLLKDDNTDKILQFVNFIEADAAAYAYMTLRATEMADAA